MLSRLGYKVRNDIIVPVPIFRSRTSLKDVVIDLAAMPMAAFRVSLRRPRSQPVPSLAKPLAVSGVLAVAAATPPLLALRALRRRSRS